MFEDADFFLPRNPDNFAAWKLQRQAARLAAQQRVDHDLAERQDFRPPYNGGLSLPMSS